MEFLDFSKPTIMYDVILIVDTKKLYCNRAILSIWSPVFETMFKANFKEKDAMEICLPGRVNLISNKCIHNYKNYMFKTKRQVVR